MTNEYVSATYSAKNRITSYAKDVYLMILTGIFSQTNTEYKWDPDDDRSKILIADRYQKPSENQPARPMIYLHRGRMAYANSSIDKLMAQDMQQHTSTYSDLIQGTMIINSVSSEGLEAEEIASMLFTILQAYNKEFMKLGFQHMAVNEILEERIIDGSFDSKLVEVPIITSFTFQHTWCVSELNLKVLQDLCIQRSMDATSEEGGLSGCTTTGRACGQFGPAEDGVQTKAIITESPCSKKSR